MTRRDCFSTYRPDCTISIVTEQRSDGTWGVVASVNHDTGSAIEVTRVPLAEGPAGAFPTEEEARAYARQAAEEWIEQNMPDNPETRPGP
jgi:hypothetical protein